MAPLSSTLAADFSEFTGECAKAQAGLTGIETSAAQVEAAVNEMATQAAGSTKQTATEITDVGTAANRSAGGFNSMTDSLKVADKTLGAFGVNLSKEINILGELQDVAGKTTSDLGALGTAGAVAGAALAGWNVGRWIADITGADTAIANLTSRIMGWGDVAGETAAANADVLARASVTAGRTITDLTEAIKINYDAVQKNAEAFNTSANRVRVWDSEIAKAKAAGNLAQIKADLESQNSTLEQLHKHYNISTEALQYLQREMRSAADATREQERADREAAKAAEAHAAARKALRDTLFGTDLITQANNYAAALGSVDNLTRVSADQQAHLNEVVGQGIDAYRLAGKVAPESLNAIYLATLQLPPIVTGLDASWKSVGETVAVSADAIVANLQRAKDETAAYEAETQRLAGAGFGAVKTGADQAKGATDGTTESVGRLTGQLQNLQSQAQSTFERLQAGMALMDAYRAAGVATGPQIAVGGYNFAQQQKGMLPTWAATSPTPGSSGPWGNTNNLNVTVNNADAKGIADQLVTEMRHNGVRL